MTGHPKDERTTVDLSDVPITIDGTQHVVESGELVVQREFLYAAADTPDDPTMTQRQISIDVELRDIESDGWSPEDGAGYIPPEEGGNGRTTDDPSPKRKFEYALG